MNALSKSWFFALEWYKTATLVENASEMKKFAEFTKKEKNWKKQFKVRLLVDVSLDRDLLADRWLPLLVNLGRFR